MGATFVLSDEAPGKPDTLRTEDFADTNEIVSDPPHKALKSLMREMARVRAIVCFQCLIRYLASPRFFAGPCGKKQRRTGQGLYADWRIVADNSGKRKDLSSWQDTHLCHRPGDFKRGAVRRRPLRPAAAWST
jgi:hypothetical protein